MTAGFPDACILPNYTLGPDNPDSYGPCLFDTYNYGNQALADELLAANQQPGADQTFVARGDNITAYEKQ